MGGKIFFNNVKTLSKCLLIDSSTLTPLLKKLESKGYIERKKNKDDERNLELTLTTKGENLKDKAIDVPSKVGSCVNLSEKDASTLYKLLYKILNNIEKEN